jgi:colicin import membrane protein
MRNRSRAKTSDYVLGSVFAVLLHVGIVVIMIYGAFFTWTKTIKVGSGAEKPKIAARTSNVRDVKQFRDIMKKQQREEKIRKRKEKLAKKQREEALRKKEELKKKKPKKVDKKKLAEKRKKDLEKKKLEKKRQREIAIKKEIKKKELEKKKKELLKRLEEKRKLAKKQKEKEEKLRKAREKKRQLLAKKRKKERLKKAREKKRLAKLRADELRREMAEEARIAKKAQQAAIAGKSSKWHGLIVERIRRFWVEPSGSDPDISCKVKMRITKSGLITERDVLSCTGGGDVYRRSVISAFKKAERVPTPSDPSVFTSTFIIEFKPSVKH